MSWKSVFLRPMQIQTRSFAGREETMREKMTIPLTAVLLCGLVLGTVTSAHGVRRQVVVGNFEVDNHVYYS